LLEISDSASEEIARDCDCNCRLNVFQTEVIFDHSNWNVWRNITMIAVDDYTDEDYHYGELALLTSSASECYLVSTHA